jgi:hypothetical protein
MQKLMMRMMLSCDKATAIMEKGHDTGLTLREKMQLLFHTSMCSGCTNYRKQSLLIHELLDKHIGKRDGQVQPVIIQQLKQEIQRRLNI